MPLPLASGNQLLPPSPCPGLSLSVKSGSRGPGVSMQRRLPHLLFLERFILTSGQFLRSTSRDWETIPTLPTGAGAEVGAFLSLGRVGETKVRVAACLQMVATWHPQGSSRPASSSLADITHSRNYVGITGLLPALRAAVLILPGATLPWAYGLLVVLEPTALHHPGLHSSLIHPIQAHLVSLPRKVK